MNIQLGLTPEQSRAVCWNHIAETLILNKQYLNETQIQMYKTMLYEFCSLLELETVVQRFDRAWPSDVKW